MQELGPFRVHSDGKTLYKNRFAWNYAANVLFVESPAGVGFSYSNTTEDYVKEYKGREFYISGESYAGHYVPQLASNILYHNKISKRNIINFKGIIIGNAVIDDEADTKGMFDYFATHALISDQTSMKINKYCDFSSHDVRQSSLCQNATTEAEANINNIDIFNIYGPLCLDTFLTNTPKFSREVFDPCSDYYVYAYLNRPDVQNALHANVTKLDYDWHPCSNLIQNWIDSPATIIPLLREFMANGFRVWIFSGDTDGRIPVTSTKYSLNKMKLKMKTPWHPWFIEGQVGGYTQVYEGNVTFATVRGAGHQVPSFQPARALSLAMHFLSGTELPNSFRH
ncbi:hypothetical protein Leryth_007149 [Lithospermum erythrorhizon]|nr:hypothetical protein Leryth_007149 [Lithospermum erythrorhizon]